MSHNVYLVLSYVVLWGIGTSLPQTSGEHAVVTPQAQTSTQPGTHEDQRRTVKAQPASPELHIGGGDVLDVKIYTGYTPADFAQTVRVDNRGNISLPLVGGVPVAGLTAQDAEARIERSYREGQYFKNPHVTVFVAAYASQEVSVFGEVTKPGVYPLVSTQTLLDVLSAAGGLTPTAGNVAKLTRQQDPQHAITVELTADGSPKENFRILPGDSIVVERSGIVYVVGDVTKPGGFPVSNRSPLTVLQAVALAEGTQPNAALNGSKLIRKIDGNFSEKSMPLKNILAGKAPDVALQAGDIIFVPSSAAKGAARRSLEAIVQTVTGVAIYRR